MHSLKLKEKPIDIEGTDGRKRRFLLREMTSPQRADYLDAVEVRKKRDAQGRVVHVSEKGLPGIIFGMTLFDDAGQAVGPSVTDTFPATLTESLWEDSLVLSGLKENAQASGNAPAASG